jgi:hypothetical protein
LVDKKLNAKDIHKEIFPVSDGKCSSRKEVRPWWQTFADNEDDESEVRKWLRQQSKGFCAVGFDTLVKQWDKCISVGGGCVKK